MIKLVIETQSPETGLWTSVAEVQTYSTHKIFKTFLWWEWEASERVEMTEAAYRSKARAEAEKITDALTRIAVYSYHPGDVCDVPEWRFNHIIWLDGKWL